jgi:hypothetical protein
VRHPEWCHTDRRAATPAAVTGEAHSSVPVTIKVDALCPLAVMATR